MEGGVGGEEEEEEGKYSREHEERKEEERRGPAPISGGCLDVPASLPRGVQYDVVSKEFTAGMSIKGKYRILGRFKDVQSAKECYEEAYMSNRSRRK